MDGGYIPLLVGGWIAADEGQGAHFVGGDGGVGCCFCCYDGAVVAEVGVVLFAVLGSL